MEKVWLLWLGICDHLMCMVAFYNLASILIRHTSNIDNLVIVSKEITGCYGEIPVVKETDTLTRGVNNRYPQTTISFKNMLKI